MSIRLFALVTTGAWLWRSSETPTFVGNLEETQWFQYVSNVVVGNKADGMK